MLTDWETLTQRLDEPTPPKWEHEPGDKLLGTVVDLGTYEGEYGSSPTVTIDAVEGSTEAGGTAIAPGERRIFYASRTVARSKVEGKKPQIGDRIGIAYKGIPDGREYHDYAVEVVGAVDPTTGPGEFPEGF